MRSKPLRMDVSGVGVPPVQHVRQDAMGNWVGSGSKKLAWTSGDVDTVGNCVVRLSGPTHNGPPDIGPLFPAGSTTVSMVASESKGCGATIRGKNKLASAFAAVPEPPML